MSSFISNIKYFLSLLVFSDYIYFGLIIALIILLAILLYLIRSSEEHLEWEKPIKNVNNDQSDIIKIANEIALSGEQLNINLTPYEMKEEEDSIISYEELLERSKNHSLNYEEDLGTEDITIKKLDIVNSISPKETETRFKPLTLSYEKEEALLAALKQLQKNLS